MSLDNPVGCPESRQIAAQQARVLIGSATPGRAARTELLRAASADYGLVEEYESLFNGTNENSADRRRPTR